LRRKERPKRVPSKMRRRGELSLMSLLALRLVVERGAKAVLANIMMRMKKQIES